MSAALLPMLVFQPLQQSPTTGQMVPIPGGKLWCYAAGTATLQAAFSDAGGLVALSNPVILDAAGVAQIYLGSMPYKFLLTDANGVTIPPYPIDNVSSIVATMRNTPMYSETIVATAGQAVFNLANSYVQGINTIAVFQNGAKLIVGSDYTETSISSITLLMPATGGDVLNFLSQNITNGVGIDASLTTFLQAGAGAVQRSLLSKDREIISVTDFGADPTGSIDSAPAINAAIATLTSGGTIYIPKGTYRLLSTISLAEDMNILGAGRRATTLTQYTSGIPVITQPAGNSYSSVSEVGLTVGGGATGVNLASQLDGEMRWVNCQFDGGDVGAAVSASYYNNFIGCEFRNQGQNGLYFTGGGGSNCNNVIGCQFRSIIGNGVKIDAPGYAVNIIGCDFESITGTGILHAGTLGVIQGCYFESVTVTGINLSAAIGVIQSGNYFAGTVTAPVTDTSNRGNQGFGVVTSSGNATHDFGSFHHEADSVSSLLTNHMAAPAARTWVFENTTLICSAAGTGSWFRGPHKDINGLQILSTRDTGWAAWTGTGSKATKLVSSATLADCAAAIKSILDAMISHGLIGA